MMYDRVSYLHIIKTYLCCKQIRKKTWINQIRRVTMFTETQSRRLWQPPCIGVFLCMIFKLIKSCKCISYSVKYNFINCMKASYWEDYKRYLLARITSNSILLSCIGRILHNLVFISTFNGRGTDKLICAYPLVNPSPIVIKYMLSVYRGSPPA